MYELMKCIKAAKPREEYTLMIKNIEVLVFNRVTGKVSIKDKQYLHYSLYLDESDEIDMRVQNIYNFDSWCADRLLSVNRMYYKEIVNACGFTQATTDRQRAEIAIQCRCLSLQDQYWLKKSNEDITWESVSLFNGSLSEEFTNVCLCGKNISISDLSSVIHNITIDGVMSKAWIRVVEGLCLFKAGNEKQVSKEIEASNILRRLGFDVVNYTHGYWQNNPITICKCFTNEDIGFVTAEAYSYSNSLCGSVDKFSDKFWRLVLSEYLIGNSDLHARNWGFLTEAGKIIDMAPLFDFDHAFELDYNDNTLESKVWRALGERKSLKESAAQACQVLGLKQEDFYFVRNQYVREAVDELYNYIRENK